MNKFLDKAPELIREAAKSTLGILALLVLAISLLALVFFATASEVVRVGIFVLIFTGGCLFVVSMMRLAKPQQNSGISSDKLEHSPLLPTYPGIPAPRQFIDRPEKREQIEGPLRSTEKWVRNIVIQGMGGTGKTVLAAEAARTVEKLFKKVIWTSANDAPLNLAELLDIVLRSLEYRSDQLTISEKKEKVSELFQRNPYLLVVDSFERIGDKEVDRFLADQVFYPSKVLITTRYIWPQASSVIALGGLTEQQTRQMMEEIGRNQGIEGRISAEDIRTIYDVTGGLPLAINLIIGQLARGGNFTRIINDLTAHGNQPHKDVTENMFESLFGGSWNLLTDVEQRMLMSMTFFTTSASLEAIKEINKTDQKQYFDNEIDNLIKMSLIQPTRDSKGDGEPRYSLHPLTRSYANNKINSDEILKNGIYRRAVNFFINLMEKMGGPGSELSKYAKLEQDLPNCLAAFEWCRNQREIANISKIVDDLNYFLFERGYWNTRIQICSAASNLQHESSLKDHEAAWRQAFFAGWVCSRQNNYDEAKQWLKEAEDQLSKIPESNSFSLFYQAKISQLCALIIHGEAVEAYKSGASEDRIASLFKQANECHDNARLLFREYIKTNGGRWTFEDPTYAIVLVDSNQGDVAVDMGRWKTSINHPKEALHHYEDAQRLYSEVLDSARNSQWENKDALIAFSAANLGHVEIWLGARSADKIRQRFEEALTIAESISRVHTVAWCHRGYGLLELLAAKEETSLPRKETKLIDAKKWLEKALDNFERLGRRERVAETRESLREVETILENLH